MRVLILVLFVTLVGCTQNDTKKISNINHETLNISVIAPVTMPEKIEYYGAERALGAALGGIIGSILAGSGNTTDEKIASYLLVNKINISKIYEDKFIEATTKSGIITFHESEKHGAKLKLKIERFGFDKGWGLSNMKPIIELSAYIVSADEKVIWKNTASVGAFTGSSTASMPINKWLEDPVVFEQEIARALSVTVDKLIRSL